MSKRILILGAKGQIGNSLCDTFYGVNEIIKLDLPDFDLRDISVVLKKIEEVSPDIIINAAAYTAVDKAESDIKNVYKINAEAVGIIANDCKKRRIGFIHYSTDYVFDGYKSSGYTENDIPNPINEYGKSKLLGENLVTESQGAYLILRTSGVYSSMKNCFVSKVLKWSRNNRTLKIVSDQIISPTWAKMIAGITKEVVQLAGENLFEYFQEKNGVYHLAGKGAVSRFDWAKSILSLDPLKSEQITEVLESVSSAKFPSAAIRPRFSALDCSKFENTFGITLLPWEKSLRSAMENWGS